MSIINMANQELNNVKALQSKMKRLLSGDPEVTLLGRKNAKGYVEFFLYYKATGERVYINRESQGLILKMLRNKYGEESLKVLKNNQLLLEYFIANYQEFDPVHILEGLPKSYQYAQDFCKDKGLFQIPESGKERFRGSEKTSSENDLIHSTSFGLKTRSKGEAMIGETLFHYTTLRFFYEKKLTLLNEFGQPVDVYPDFTIIHPLEGLFFWEHKGMMSDSEYVKRDQWKMDLYFRNGIYVPKNLIVTCDSPKGGTDMNSIAKLVRGYFGGFLNS